MGKPGKQRRLQETSPSTPKQRAAARYAWRLFVLWGLLLIAYSNSFQCGLVFDNAAVVGQDPRIRQATLHDLASILTGGYRYDKPSAGLYRPLTTLSYMVNYVLLGNGPRPEGYHWINLALHAANTALVYGLGIIIFGETAPAWALAAVWGLHPLLTESVTNIVGRADLLAAFGVLAGLSCHACTASAAGWRRLAWLFGITTAQTIGLFSKESAVVLPGIMLAYDLVWFNRSSWRRRVPAYGALLLPFAAFFYLRAQVHPHLLIPFADNPLVKANFWTARLTAVEIVGKFLVLFLWPAGLSADYSYHAVPLFGEPLTAQALVELAVCMAVVLLLVFMARRAQKPIVFLLVFFFVAILPTSNLIVPIGSIMAERFLYLPSVGLAGCVAAAICWAGRRVPTARASWAAAGLVCLALAARTYARNLDWKDDLSLWTSATEVCPGSAKAHYNLGKALEVLPGRMPGAIAEYRSSLRIDPDHADVHTNLANALAAAGRVPEAIREYREALRTEPNRVEPHNDLANALARIPGQLPEAIAEYRAALLIRPSSAEVHYNLANALLNQPGGLTEAVTEYRAALGIDPDHVDAHINLGNALAGIPGRAPEAIAEYRSALRIQPGSRGARIGLGNALSRLPDGLSAAIIEYREVLNLWPDDAEAHYDLGTALAQMPDRLPEAIAEFESALRNRPDLMEAHVNLANALSKIPGRIPDAIAEYEAALRISPDPVVRQMVDRLKAEHRGASPRR
jgi:tetratricopeptide (TPR) repeat protein